MLHIKTESILCEVACFYLICDLAHLQGVLQYNEARQVEQVEPCETACAHCFVAIVQELNTVEVNRLPTEAKENI